MCDECKQRNKRIIADRIRSVATSSLRELKDDDLKDPTIRASLVEAANMINEAIEKGTR